MTAHLPPGEPVPAIERSAGAIAASLGILAATGIALPNISDAGVPAHLRRRDARRVMSARELHEAADMAEQGTPIPGTLADVKLRAALSDGEFTRANEIRESIKSYAPAIRAAAIAAANGDRQRMAEETARAIADVQTQERARLKRARKASARKRAQDAMMRSAARGQ